MLPKNKRHGFSLLELTIVLAITALIIGVSLGTLTWLNRFFVAMQVDYLLTQCTALQYKAVALNKAQSITFDRNKKCYYANSKVESLPATVQWGAPAHVKGPPSHPEQLISNPITFAHECINFYPDGTMNSGAVYLTDQSHSCCYALTIPVGEVPYIRTYQYHKNWQQRS